MEETMMAAVLYAPGDLKVEKVPLPKLDDEKNVLVKVMAVGVCGSDLDRVMKTGTYSFPTIPGHEFAGIIEKTNNDSKFKKGDRVVVAPLIPCFKCEYCQQGYFGQCKDYDFIGSRCDGAFAEYVAVPERNILKIPENVSFTEGATIEPAAVSLHGMRKIGVNVGDNVLVLGCGAIGLFAIQFAKIMGATNVIAVDIEDEKLELARKVGADITINSKIKDAVNEIMILTGDGVDLTVETAGVAATQEQSLRTTKKQGRVLYLGTAHKEVVFPPQSFEKILRNEIKIVGSWNSYSGPYPGTEWTACIDYISQKRLDCKSLVTHEMKLESAFETIQKMQQRSFSFTKVVFSFQE